MLVNPSSRGEALFAFVAAVAPSEGESLDLLRHGGVAAAGGGPSGFFSNCSIVDASFCSLMMLLYAPAALGTFVSWTLSFFDVFDGSSSSSSEKNSGEMSTGMLLLFAWLTGVAGVGADADPRVGAVAAAGVAGWGVCCSRCWRCWTAQVIGSCLRFGKASTWWWRRWLFGSCLRWRCWRRWSRATPRWGIHVHGCISSIDSVHPPRRCGSRWRCWSGSPR